METFQLHNYRNLTWISIAVLALMLSTLGLDLVYSHLHSTSYYLSESLLFSSFWFWFIPFLNVLFLVVSGNKSIPVKILLTVIIWAAHLIIYPGSIWLLSYFTLSHTFPYSQTFYFGVTEYALKSALVYTLTIPLFFLVKSKIQKTPTASSLDCLMLTENNKTFNLETKDILYFSANSPYVSVHILAKKHLYSETLKGLEQKLDPAKFVRIHKSYIVNIVQVTSYQSRLNGDYDLTLTDNTVLRVSRNYAQTFKEIFKRSHPLSTE